MTVPLDHIVALRGARNGYVPDATKLRGGYYTPPAVAEFLATWAVRDPSARVLEPSCGDGALIAAVLPRLGPEGRITGIELFEDEAVKALRRGGSACSVVAGDAFSWFNRLRPEAEFDACLGNPPFVRYQSFPEDHRAEAFSLMQAEGLNPSRLTNAWVPFVALATRGLRPGGRLALVLPAELLQVGYAGELREYLTRKYSHLTVVNFRRLVFPEIQQETVLLLGTRLDTTNGADIAFVEIDAPEDLKLEPLLRAERVHADLDHGREKWTQFFLSASELSLIRDVERSNAFTTLGDLAEVDVGVVTGRNEFFVLAPSQARALSLRGACVRLVGRSAQTPGLVLRDSDWRGLEREDSRCLLLQLGDVSRDALTKAARAYVEWGEEHGVDGGYKCRIRRPNWWRVPSVWTPDAFLLRQIHDGPRIIENRAGATSTDTIHRVRVKHGVSAGELAAASVNSLTFAFSEIRGRSYGGGVLELEPTEAEGLPYPRPSGKVEVDELDRWSREKRPEKLLDEVDRALLSDAGLTASEIKTLRGIWQKLFRRRVGRKRR